MLFFSSVYKKKIWGGRALEKILGKELPDSGLYGESWEASAHPNGLGVVLNGEYKGMTLPDILKKDAEKILGAEIYKKYGDNFPLLLKFLDINDKLSIQVHPDDMYAIPVEKSFGKAECWYIMHASPDAKIIMGMKEGITKDIYLEKAALNDFTGMFEEVGVKSGDLVVIQPGMVHASLEGSVFICEVQQNSDITYRIYDFDRLEDGRKRPLHIQKSADVIDFAAKADIRHCDEASAVLLDWEYFKLSRYTLSGDMSFEPFGAVRLYTVLSGEFLFEDMPLKSGSAVLLPANEAMSIKGSSVILEVYPK